uniref:G_PROTEIN_RECEP_F1_2 domain-containing protein n=1 Tax=Heligmosomoides polygyrus TaxID=6339 RepID=A0A183G0I5_HELPZ
LPFTPERPASCSPFAVFLFSQPASLNVVSEYCDGACEQREKFRMDVFKQRYTLRLRALSWISVCYDLPYAYHVIRSAMNSTVPRTAKERRSVMMRRHGLCSNCRREQGDSSSFSMLTAVWVHVGMPSMGVFICLFIVRGCPRRQNYSTISYLKRKYEIYTTRRTRHMLARQKKTDNITLMN